MMNSAQIDKFKFLEPEGINKQKRIFTRKFYKEDIGYKVFYIIGFIVGKLSLFIGRISQLLSLKPGGPEIR